ncbi:Kinase [Hexamita inflata]|uniref:CMGC n=1 Tax=Hexamita inflata TaxID=28002 RepID=A0AA86U5D4_9EUKA|nr:CMGC [Hexamita inflata]
MSEVIIAQTDKYTITNEKRGEGTFGSVYIGYFRQDPTQPLAFKIMKQQDKVTGFVQQNNIRELTFLSEVTEKVDLQTSPFVPLVDILLGDILQVFRSQDDIKQSLIVVMPCYPVELSNLMYSQKMLKMPLDDMLMVSKKLLSLVYKMHKMGYAHRDLKHNNILVQQNWRFVLIDFGMVQFDPDMHAPDLPTDSVKTQPVQSELDPRSTALTALYWRPPEQIFSKTQIISTPEHSQILKQMKNGYYSDSYVLGLMLLELHLGATVFRCQQPEEQGGLEELAAYQLFSDREFCVKTFLDLYKTKLSATGVLDKLNELNGSTFQDLSSATSWCKYTFQQLVLKALLIKYWNDQMDVTMFVKIQSLRNIITQLLQFNVTKRKTVIEVLTDNPDFLAQDHYDFDKQLTEKYGLIKDQNKEKNKSVFLAALEKHDKKTEGFVLKRVADVMDQDLEKWISFD